MWPEGFYLGASGLHIQLGPPPAERHIPNLKTPGQDPTALTEGQGGRRARTVRSSEGLGGICPSSYLYSSHGCRTRPTGLGAPFPTRIPKTPLKDHSRPNKTEKTTPAHPNPATEMETPPLTPNQMRREPRLPRAQLAPSP